MNLKEYLHIAPDVEAAIAAHRPVVALSSTALLLDMPRSEALHLLEQAEDCVRAAGAVPATITVVGGRMQIGSTEAVLHALQESALFKVTRSGLAEALAEKRTGVATAACGMVLASLAGIRILAVDGIGGVRSAQCGVQDVSADLYQLCRTPVAVVCAGVKAADTGCTLEYLETHGVPVLTLGTNYFPGFYSQNSAQTVDCCVEHIVDAARILKVEWDLGLPSGAVVAQRIDDHSALDATLADAVLQEAMEAAQEAQIHGSALTAWILADINRRTQGASFTAHKAAVLACARTAGALAAAYSQL